MNRAAALTTRSIVSRRSGLCGVIGTNNNNNAFGNTTTRQLSSYQLDGWGGSRGGGGGGGGAGGMMGNWPVTKSNTIFNIVPQGYKFIIERFGKLHSIEDSGWFLAIPFVDQIAYVIDVRERAIDIEPQAAITRDNVSVEVSGNLFIKFDDPEAAAYGALNPLYSVTQVNYIFLIRYIYIYVCVCIIEEEEEDKVLCFREFFCVLVILLIFFDKLA
jgi:hypothetical protein